jgi:hypothetical protein
VAMNKREFAFSYFPSFKPDIDENIIKIRL